jgi:hypothetical protein
LTRWQSFTATLKKWANEYLALCIAYGVDLTGITVLMANIAPPNDTKWAFFGLGYLLVTVKLTAVRKKWMLAWVIAALVNVFTSTSFFVTATVPETTRPLTTYEVAAKDAFDKAVKNEDDFKTGKKNAEDENRLTLLRDQYNPTVEASLRNETESVRTKLTEATERAKHEPVTGLEVFGRVPRLLKEKSDFAAISLVLFFTFASGFVELALFYLKGGRFRTVKAIKTEGASGVETVEPVKPPAVTTVYPRDREGRLIPPFVAARQLGINTTEAMKRYEEEKETK